MGSEMCIRDRVALGVVIAAGGYPIEYETGSIIEGLHLASSNTKVFHAGTIEVEGEIKTNGGRVLCVVGAGESVASAAELAYARVNNIKWKDHYFRADIGHRAIKRESD